MIKTQRQIMLDKVISKYGFEASETLQFATLIERDVPDSYVEWRYAILMV